MATPLLFDRSFKPQSVVTANASNAAVYYNGFKFPTALRCSAQVTAVYDDANRMVMYNELRVKVSFYLFHGLNLGHNGTAASPNTSTNLYSGSYNYANNIPSGLDETSPSSDGVKDDDFSTDQEMEFLKGRLLEPGQHLQVTAQGLGTINVQDPTVSTSVDVDNGPKPELVTWRPLSNKCCYIEWAVVTRYSPCASIYPSTIAQFPFTVEFDINNRGLTTRTITGAIETIMSRTSEDELVSGVPVAHAGIAADFDVATRRAIVTQTFPMLTGFHRSQKYKLSADRKRLDFTIIDDEIDSDEAYGEGCAREDVKLSTRNTVSKVFGRWAVNLSGRIELAAGYPKSYALAEISRLFTRHFKVCGALATSLRHTNPSSQERSEGQENNSGSGSTDSKVTEVNNTTHYLEDISFTDHLFGRVVEFSISWTLATTLQTLFAATGMFVPARYYPVDGNGLPVSGGPVSDPAQAQRDQWILWKTSLGIFLDNGGFQALDFRHTSDEEEGSDDVIVSLCTPMTGATRAVPELNIQYDPEIGENETQEITTSNTWADYQPQFSIIRNEHASPHFPLGANSSSQETASSPDAALELTSFNPRGPSSPDPLQVGVTHYQREPSYTLSFSGYAIRLNYPVPEPNVEKYGTRDAIPIGESYLFPEFIGNGTDLTTGESYKIYGLKWHKTYALLDKPTNAKIVTDAHKDIYVS